MLHDEARLRNLARQYNWLRERGENHTEAINSLQHNSGEACQSVLNTLVATQQNATPDPFVSHQLGRLNAVLDRTTADTSKRSALLFGSLVLADQLKDIGSQIREKIMTRYSYMVILCLVGLFVSTVYVVYVYPQMMHFASVLNIGQTLGTADTPLDLSPLYHLGLIGYPLIFLVLAVVTGLSCLFAIKGSYDLGSGKNFAAPMHFMPGITAIDTALKSYLYAGLTQIYARSGYSPSQSAELADTMVSNNNPDQKEAVDLARKLGTLENELAYQQKQSRLAVESALERAIVLWNRVLTAVTAIVLYFMITDYYRPLFRIDAT